MKSFRIGCSFSAEIAFVIIIGAFSAIPRAEGSSNHGVLQSCDHLRTLPSSAMNLSLRILQVSEGIPPRLQEPRRPQSSGPRHSSAPQQNHRIANLWRAWQELRNESPEDLDSLLSCTTDSEVGLRLCYNNWTRLRTFILGTQSLQEDIFRCLATPGPNRDPDSLRDRVAALGLELDNLRREVDAFFIHRLHGVITIPAAQRQSVLGAPSSTPSRDSCEDAKMIMEAQVAESLVALIANSNSDAEIDEIESQLLEGVQSRLQDIGCPP